MKEPVQSVTNSKPISYSWLSTWLGQMPLAELESFCSRLGMGLRSGVDVLKLFESEARRGTARHRNAMLTIRERMQGGSSMAEAFQSAGPYFPPLLIQLVSAGESAGRLDRILAHMSHYYQTLRTARRNFLSQIAWPLIQLVIAIAVIALVIAVRGLVMRGPEEDAYDPLGFGLAGSSGVAVFLSMVALAACLIAGLVIAVWKNVFQCHRRLLPLVLPVPILGAVFSNLAMSRMTMTLSMLLNAGVDAMKAMREAFLSTGNDYYIQAMPKSLAQIQRGQSLALSLEAAQVFPRDFIEGVEVGELSGNETESLEALTAEYARRASSALTQLSMAAGVAIWIFIACLIIFMIIRMAMQYVNMLNSLM